jgi:fructosamine-3-kinase
VHPLVLHAARLLNAEARSARPLAGGSIDQVLRVRFADGGRAVVKAGAAPEREARMLAALRARGAPVPDVLAADARVLVLSEVPNRGTPEGAWRDLAEVLVRLHAPDSAQGRYGWDEDAAFGPLAIPGGRDDLWPRFWAERRLLAHAARLPSDLAGRVERLAAGLPERLPARPPVALLHGDLWTGNVLVDGPRVTALIDPACSHGHAEVDLAMLTLFASPGADFASVYPVEPGWRERRAVYQLWPALVHLLLFGEGYRPLVERLLDDAGA